MRNFLFLLIAVSLFSCSKSKVEHVEKAFYYWKANEYSFNGKEDSVLKKLKVNKLYVKFFEVDRNEMMGNIPISKTDLGEFSWNERKIKMHIIPVVYLKNAVFLKISKAELDTLINNVDFLIKKYSKEKFNKASIPEIQMDCDWTLKSRDNYFYFLKGIQALSGKKLSCTLRLYPYKYPEKMGVPPVDSATLMCYNLINPMENKTKNSILDTEELASYLNKRRKYPVHLDIALPIYSWMHVFKNNRFSNVVYTGKSISKILKPIKPMWFEITKDTVVDGSYLRVGDNVKYEETTSKKLFDAIAIIQKNVFLDKTTTISLFHLDDIQLNNYSYETLDHFFTDFSR